jgi:hypothetical protein
MKRLILFAILFSGCTTAPPTLTTFCRHQVLAQHARAVELYGVPHVTTIWLKHAYKKNPDGTPATHAQVKVWHNGRFWFLSNRWSDEQFSSTPQRGWIEQGVYDYPYCLPMTGGE